MRLLAVASTICKGFVIKTLKLISRTRFTEQFIMNPDLRVASLLQHTLIKEHFNRFME